MPESSTHPIPQFNQDFIDKVTAEPLASKAAEAAVSYTRSMIHQSRAKDPLQVRLVGNRLEITIGIDTLAYAVQKSASWPDGTIKDPELFAEEMVRVLQKEDPMSEGETSLAQALLDEAAEYVQEEGSESIDHFKGSLPTLKELRDMDDSMLRTIYNAVSTVKPLCEAQQNYLDLVAMVRSERAAQSPK